jgi:hypothetical protein
MRPTSILATISLVAIVCGPARADYADLTPAQQFVLAHELGLSETFTIDGETHKLTDLAKQSAAQERARRTHVAVAAVDAVPVPIRALQAAPAVVRPVPEGQTPRDVVIPRSTPLPLASPAAITLPAVAPKATPPPSYIAASNAANFFADLAHICLITWLSSATCNVDLTGAQPAKWAAGPPGKSSAPDIGSDDATATPPPLQSVNGGPQKSQTALDLDVVGARAMQPPIAVGAQGPPALLAALHDADMQPAFASAVNVPAAALHGEAHVGDLSGDYASITFDGAATAPDFFIGNEQDAAFGLTATATTTFDMQMTILKHSFSTHAALASLSAQVAAPAGPLGGKGPRLDIAANVLGVSGNKHEEYGAVGPSLAYREARKQLQTTDACNLSQSLQLVASVNLALTLSCPVTVGYVLALNAAPSEASFTLSPVAAIGLNGSADVSAAAGLVSVDVIASANVLTLDGRLGAYFDMVRNPTPASPDDAGDTYVSARPFHFATVQALDGVL